MSNHQEIFSAIKQFLTEHVDIHVDELSYGTHLTINQTGFWMEFEAEELTIGYGLTHRHYDLQHGELIPALDRLFNLLTKPKRITLYSKGDQVFKEKTEILLDDNNYEELGVAVKWIVPFWKRTTVRTTFEEPLINYLTVENKIRGIYKLA